MIQFFFVAMTFFLVAGCGQHPPGWGHLHYESGPIEKTDKNIRVPRALAHVIEEEYLEAVVEKGEGHDNASELRAQLLAEVPRLFFDLRIQIADPDQRTLHHPYEFLFPKGGGLIELSSVLEEERGKFWLRVDLSHNEIENWNLLRVFYISDSQSRTLGKEKLGAGCSKVIEISKYFRDVMMRDGVKAYVTEGRYLSLLAGTYVLLLVESKKMYLSTFSLRDSRYPDYQCGINN